MMHGHEKSDSAIVAGKLTNKAERSAAESVEPRAETKGNAGQQHTRRTQRRISVSQMLARIRQHIVAVDTRGGSRMRESCTSGSLRGARGNSRPYRNAPTINPPEVAPEKPPAPRAHGRLFRKYVGLFLAVVCIALYVRSRLTATRSAAVAV
jgi:hypothetical protein